MQLLPCLTGGVENVSAKGQAPEDLLAVVESLRKLESLEAWRAHGTKHWIMRGWGGALPQYLASLRVRYADLGPRGVQIGGGLLRRYSEHAPPPSHAKPYCAHRGLAVDKARGLEVEDFGGGIIGFRLPEEGAGADAAEAVAPVKPAKGGGRRKAVG